MKLITWLGGAALATMTTAGASAVTTQTIDFTNKAAWPDGFATASLFGSTVSLSPQAPIRNVQNYDGAPGATMGLAEISDGLGVIDDEVSFPTQSITVNFSGRGVRVTGLHFLDLFLGPLGEEEEVAEVSFNGGAPITFSAAATALPTPGNAGYAFYGFSPIEVTSVTFTAAPTNDARGVPDYALAAIEVAPIPIPAAGLLALTGLAGLGLLGRRRKTA